MRAMAMLACVLTGCQHDGALADKRPSAYPAPADVRQEIRDARYFLPLPDEGASLPSVGLQPGLGGRAGGR